MDDMPVIGFLPFEKWFWEHMNSAPPVWHTVGWRDKRGQFEGGFAINRYTGKGGSCHVHFAGKRGWITRGRLRQIAHYLFNHLQCEVLFGEVPANEPEVLKLDKRIGFREVAVLEGYFAGGIACILLAMQRGECRWF